MEQTILLSIIIFVLCFIIFYLVNCRKAYLIISKKSKKKKKEIVIFPIKYLQSRFKLKEETLITINNLRMYAFLDSLIISITFFTVVQINVHYALQLFIGLILLLGLIYALYEIYGRHLKKKENRK